MIVNLDNEYQQFKITPSMFIIVYYNHGLDSYCRRGHATHA